MAFNQIVMFCAFRKKEKKREKKNTQEVCAMVQSLHRGLEMQHGNPCTITWLIYCTLRLNLCLMLSHCVSILIKKKKRKEKERKKSLLVGGDELNLIYILRLILLLLLF